MWTVNTWGTNKWYGIRLCNWAYTYTENRVSNFGVIGRIMDCHNDKSGHQWRKRLHHYSSQFQCTHSSWWRHQMEVFSALLSNSAGNLPVTGEFPTQRPVTRSFDVIFDLRLNKRLNKQSWGWCFETLSHTLWRLHHDSSRFQCAHSCYG